MKLCKQIINGGVLRVVGIFGIVPFVRFRSGACRLNTQTKESKVTLLEGPATRRRQITHNTLDVSLVALVMIVISERVSY